MTHVYVQYKYAHTNVGHALLCFVEVWYKQVLLIPFKVTSLALEQSYECDSANKGTLKNVK